MSLRINPQYKKIMPQMSFKDFEELKISILTEGQHYPIIANENLEILDGHHRFRACIELGIDPDFEIRKFEDKLIEKKFVIESNLRRRHLNSYQLVELGVPLLEIEKKLAKKRQIEGGKIGRARQLGLVSYDANPSIKKSKATEVVAKKIGLSTRTFERGKKIYEKATEEEKQKLRAGKKSIAKAYNELSSPKLGNKNKSEIFTKHDLIESKFNQENQPELLNLLKELLDSKLICPYCGSSMFECSRCHKTIQDLLKTVKK